MSGSRTAVMTESDTGGGDAVDLADIGPAPRGPVAPPGLINDPSSAGASRQSGGANGNRAAEPEYTIVEADSNYRPLYQDDGANARPDDNRQAAGDQDEGTQTDHLADGQQSPRRREDRAARRARQREARDRTNARNEILERQVADLTRRLDSYEPRFSQFDQAQVHVRVQELDRQIDQEAARAASARRKITEAMSNGDSEAFGTALDERDQAVARGQQLAQQKALVARGYTIGDDGVPVPPQQQRQPQPNAQDTGRPQPTPMPAAVRENVEDFAAAHPWYNPQDPNSLDSKIVLQIDAAVAAEGFDPATPDYWDEVEGRMQQYLPHRFRAGAQPADGHVNGGNGAANGFRPPAPRQQQRQLPPERRGPMVSGASDRAPAQGGNRTVYLTPERKETLQLAGVLSADGRTVTDQTKFQRYMRQYEAFDRANNVGAR